MTEKYGENEKMTEYRIITQSELKEYIGHKAVIVFARIMRSKEGKITYVSQKHTSLEIPISGDLFKIPTNQILMAEVKI